MVQVKFNKSVLDVAQCSRVNDIHDLVRAKWKLKRNEYYLLRNGRPLAEDVENEQVVHVVPKLCGGKGGFGSMLRAIGAQIEKTTNREACRDLSGRRLRDINEEKRLKAWIDQQAAREQEAADKRQKKLERLCEKPKHEFNDDRYFEEREKLPEQVEDAVAQGMQAASSTSGATKRKHDVNDVKKKKKLALWVDDALDDLSSGTESSSDEESEEKLENSPKECEALSEDASKEDEAKPENALNESEAKSENSPKESEAKPGIALKGSDLKPEKALNESEVKSENFLKESEANAGVASRESEAKSENALNAAKPGNTSKDSEAKHEDDSKECEVKPGSATKEST